MRAEEHRRKNGKRRRKGELAEKKSRIYPKKRLLRDAEQKNLHKSGPGTKEPEKN